MSLMNSVEHTNLIDVRSVEFRFGLSTLSSLKNGAPRWCVPEMCSGEWMCWMPAAYGMRLKSKDSEIRDRDMLVVGAARNRVMGMTGKHEVLGINRR